MAAATIKPDHLGGSMYGDGEYVVDFANADSVQAPLKATVIGGALGGSFVEVTFGRNERRPSCGLAAQAIDAARRAVTS